jgi:hypothetical protein
MITYPRDTTAISELTGQPVNTRSRIGPQLFAMVNDDLLRSGQPSPYPLLAHLIVLALLASAWTFLSYAVGGRSWAFGAAIICAMASLIPEIEDPTGPSRVWGVTGLTLGVAFLAPIYVRARYGIESLPVRLTTFSALVFMGAGSASLAKATWKTWTTEGWRPAIVKLCGTVGTIVGFATGIAFSI